MLQQTGHAIEVYRASASRPREPAGELDVRPTEGLRMGLSAREWLALWEWGDLSPDRKPHLRYPSVWRWLRAERVPLPLTHIADPAERQRRQREYQELWRYLLVHHLAGLPEAEQQLFREGWHPSQSHDGAAAAEPVAARLRAELAARGIAAEVSVGHYFDGRTVLDVLLPAWPLAGQWPDDLSFFQGFEAHVCSRSPEWSPPEDPEQAEPGAAADRPRDSR
jgi:hypothetical protein